MTAPESWETEVRDRWRDALDTYLARKKRVGLLRAELAAARTAGLALRHANKLRRTRAGTTTTKEAN